MSTEQRITLEAFSIRQFADAICAALAQTADGQNAYYSVSEDGFASFEMEAVDPQQLARAVLNQLRKPAAKTGRNRR
jgi:hypothetical protein